MWPWGTALRFADAFGVFEPSFGYAMSGVFGEFKCARDDERTSWDSVICLSSGEERGREGANDEPAIMVFS